MASSQEIDWPYDDYYGENMVYIHAIANYELHPFWHEKWEKNLFCQNMMRLNFASISNTELLSDARLALNEELSSGLWFRYAATYYATHHRNEQDKHVETGFEKQIYRPLSVFIYGDPHFEKEEIDVQYGLSLTNKSRTNYLRLAYRDIDVFWNDKNNIKSRDMKKPWQFVWETNLTVGPFRFFSQGQYDDGSERSFVATEGRDRFSQRKKMDDLVFKLFYYRTHRSFIEAAYSRYHFEEEKAFAATDDHYSYQNEIELIKIGYITPVSDNSNVRFGAHVVIQDAGSTGYGAHDYHHAEFIPFFFAERCLGPGVVEAGYMGSMQKWDYVGLFEITHPHQSGYVDKIKLAYTFNFDNRVYLQFAVSHVTTIWGFGGGNVQFWLEL
ncbi:hypothetical protein JXA02_11990 [candidate division KSB1 bacterium]|nr:hypothetical protein [candidate division KSB1 bacterium]RQW01899.1 MAG: hypothetical protein EH222_14330 [candidate division KSB1 bacterium]